MSKIDRMHVPSLEEAIEARGVHDTNPEEINKIRRIISDAYRGKEGLLVTDIPQARVFSKGLKNDFGLNVRDILFERGTDGVYRSSAYVISISGFKYHRRGSHDVLKASLDERPIIEVIGRDYFAVIQALVNYAPKVKARSHMHV